MDKQPFPIEIFAPRSGTVCMICALDYPGTLAVMRVHGLFLCEGHARQAAGYVAGMANISQIYTRFFSDPRKGREGNA